jgi:hypothetical protein
VAAIWCGCAERVDVNYANQEITACTFSIRLLRKCRKEVEAKIKAAGPTAGTGLGHNGWVSTQSGREKVPVVIEAVMVCWGSW